MPYTITTVAFVPAGVAFETLHYGMPSGNEYIAGTGPTGSPRRQCYLRRRGDMVMLDRSLKCRLLPADL